MTPSGQNSEQFSKSDVKTITTIVKLQKDVEYIVTKMDEINEKFDDFNQELTGNGYPEKGLFYKVTSLEIRLKLLTKVLSIVGMALLILVASEFWNLIVN